MRPALRPGLGWSLHGLLRQHRSTRRCQGADCASAARSAAGYPMMDHHEAHGSPWINPVHVNHCLDQSKSWIRDAWIMEKILIQWSSMIIQSLWGIAPADQVFTFNDLWYQALILKIAIIHHCHYPGDLGSHSAQPSREGGREGYTPWWSNHRKPAMWSRWCSIGRLDYWRVRGMAL